MNEIVKISRKQAAHWVPSKNPSGKIVYVRLLFFDQILRIVESVLIGLIRLLILSSSK